MPASPRPSVMTPPVRYVSSEKHGASTKEEGQLSLWLRGALEPVALAAPDGCGTRLGADRRQSGSADSAIELAGHSLQGFDRAGHEGGGRLGHRVIDAL